MPDYRWKMVYENGREFTDRDGEPGQSPPWGLVAVGQPDVLGKDVLFNAEYYIHRTDTDEWSAHDLIGFIDQQVHFAQAIDCARVGRDMLTPSFKAIVSGLTAEVRGP